MKTVFRMSAKISAGGRPLSQEAEGAAENVVAVRVVQAGVAGEQALNLRDGIAPSVDELREEQQNVHHVGDILRALGADGVHFAADENPQRAFNQEWAKFGC